MQYSPKTKKNGRSPPPHVTLFRPAVPFLSGRCGCASQHKVFRNTASFLDRPLFNTPFAATNTEFSLVTSGTMLRPLLEYCTTQTSRKASSAVVMPPPAHRELQGKQNKTKLHATTPTSTDHISTGSHCSASAITLRATRRLAGS